MLPLQCWARPTMQRLPALFTRPSLSMLAKPFHLSCRLQTTDSSPLLIHHPSSLRNLTPFPPFASLPPSRIRRHWCFLAEIQYISWFLRLRIDVQDRDGAPATVYFYTPDRGGTILGELKTGYTLAVFYATEHLFGDGQTGIRVDAGRAVKVLPYSLAELMDANDALFDPNCPSCGERLNGPAPHPEMLYCNKVCKETHGPGGRVLEAAAWFVKRNWKTGHHMGAIHLRGKDGVKRIKRVVGPKEWAGYREALGMFPPSYEGPLRDIRSDSPEFQLLMASSGDLKGSGSKKRREKSEERKGDDSI